VNVNIFQPEHKEKVRSLDNLPASCWDSAEMLDKQREIYERHDVFPARIIDGIIKDLKKFNDKDIRKEIEDNPAKMMEVVRQFYHCG
jgi:glutamine synthetase